MYFARMLFVEMRPGRSAGLLALGVLVSMSLCAETVRLTGQIVCCEDCWNEADRTKVPFGTTEDLSAAAGCIGNGEVPVLAVSRNGATEMVGLSEGRFRFNDVNWLDYVGAEAAVSGEMRMQKGKPVIRVNTLEVLSPSLAAQESERAVGTAPTLALPDLAGVEQSIAGLRGRIVVLNFWGTFCLPCVKEIPELAAIQREYAALGVEVIGAAADPLEDRAKVMAFVREYGVNFPVWLGATAADMRRFGAGQALPATVLLDRDGKVVWQKRGVIDGTELRRQIDALLEGTLGAARSDKRGGDRVQTASTRPTPEDASIVPS